MDRHLLKLDPPYSIIYADGKIGRHIANVICTDFILEKDLDIDGLYAETYPVLDCGGLMPAGSVAFDTIVEDCRVILQGKAVAREENPKLTLHQFARLVEFDSQQRLPLGPLSLYEQLAEGMYACLVKANKEGRVSFKNVLTFNMDEYVGLPEWSECST